MPAARLDDKTGIWLSLPVLKLTSRSRDARPSHSDEVSALLYLIYEGLGFSVDLIGCFVALFFGNFGDGGGHGNT
jgi:hypothetical protein